MFIKVSSDSHIHAQGNGISKSPGHLKIPNLNSKLRGNLCFKYPRFGGKNSNIRIIFRLKNCRTRIRIFEIREKDSNLNPNNSFISDQGGFGINQGWGSSSSSSKETRVSLYSAAGWQRDLAPLNTPRRSHGCASYTDTSGQEVNACS